MCFKLTWEGRKKGISFIKQKNLTKPKFDGGWGLLNSYVFGKASGTKNLISQKGIAKLPKIHTTIINGSLDQTPYEMIPKWLYFIKGSYQLFSPSGKCLMLKDRNKRKIRFGLSPQVGWKGACKYKSTLEQQFHKKDGP